MNNCENSLKKLTRNDKRLINSLAYRRVKGLYPNHRDRFVIERIKIYAQIAIFRKAGLSVEQAIDCLTDDRFRRLDHLQQMLREVQERV